MRYLKSSRGFSLVELVMALAIGSLLVAGVIAGQSSLRKTTAFTASVDQVVNQVKGFKTQAQQSINGSGTGAADQTVYGQLVEFDGSNPSNMSVSTLVANSDGSALSKCGTQSVPLQNGAQYQPNGHIGGGTTGAGSKQALIFTRDPDRVYIAPDHYTDPGTSCFTATFTPPSSAAPASACGSWGNNATLQRDPNNAYGICVCNNGYVQNSGGVCVYNAPYPAPTIDSPINGAVVIGSTVNVQVSNLVIGNTANVTAAGKNCTPTNAVVSATTMSFSCDLSTAGSSVTIIANQTNAVPFTSPNAVVTVTHYAQTISPPVITQAVADGAYVVLTIKGSAGATVKVYECPSSIAYNLKNAISCTSFGTAIAIPATVFDSSGQASVRFKSSAAGGHYYYATQTDPTGESNPSNMVNVTTYSILSGGLSGNYYRLTPVTTSYTVWTGIQCDPVYDSKGNIISYNCYNTYQTYYSSYISSTYTGRIAPDQLGDPYTAPNWIGTLRARTGSGGGDGQEVDWYGYVKVPSTGNYQICTDNDDGAQVFVNGAFVVNNWPTSQGHVCGTISLNANTYYSVNIYYQNNCYCGGGDAAMLRLWFNGSQVPNSWLYYDVPFNQALAQPKNPRFELATKLKSFVRQWAHNEVARFEKLKHSAVALSHSLSQSSAQAAAPCDTNILNPNNYSSTCFGTNANTTIQLKVPGETGTGYLNIDHNSNTINRSIQ